MVVDVARQARNVGAPFHVSLESAGIKLASDSADRSWWWIVLGHQLQQFSSIAAGIECSGWLDWDVLADINVSGGHPS
jgi:hypothetical protein